MQKHYYLSDKEQEFFYKNGYVGPFTLYEPEEMTRIWEGVRMDLLDTGPACFPDSKLNYDRHLDLADLNQIISHPRIVDRVSSILGPDVLSWRTEPLTEDVTIAGDVVAHLFASTSGSDSDWVVKLIDVYPPDYTADTRLAGYQLMVASEVFRGRFRESFEHPAAISPEAANPATWKNSRRFDVPAMMASLPLCVRFA